MDIEDVFGDYQNGNYNVGNNSTAANDFLTSTETKMGGGSNPNGSGQKPPKPPKQKKKGGGGIIIFLLLVLIIIGALAFLYFKTDILSNLFKKETPKGSFMSTVSAGVNEYSSMGKTAINKINKDGDMSVKGSFQTKGSNTNMKYNYAINKKDGYLGINIENLLDIIVTDNTAYIGDSSLPSDKKYIAIRNENLDKVYENFLGDSSDSEESIVSINSDVKVPDSVSLKAENVIPSEKVKKNIAKIISDDFNEAFGEDRFLKEEATVDINGEDKEVTRYYIKTTADECAELAKKMYSDIISDSEVKSYLTGLGVYDSVKEAVDSLEEDETTRNVNEITYSVYESKGSFVGARVETDTDEYVEIIKTEQTESSIAYVLDSATKEQVEDAEGEMVKSKTEIVIADSEVGYSISSNVIEGDNEGDNSRTAISNISPEGYEYSLESSSGASSVVFSGKVKYEVDEDDVVDVSESEAYVLNDAETDEQKEEATGFITSFAMKAAMGVMMNGGFSGGDTPSLFEDPSANINSNTVVENPTNTVANIVDEPLPLNIIDIPEVVDVKTYSLYNTVLEEVKTVLTACITESQNNQMDITNYLNVGNLTANCPSLLTATLDKTGDSKFEGILTDTEGKQYKLVVDVDGFSSLTFDIVNP